MISSILFCVVGCHGADIGFSFANTLSVRASTAKFLKGLIALFVILAVIFPIAIVTNFSTLQIQTNLATENIR